MRLAIAAAGRLRTGPEAALVDDYAKRIRAGGRAIGFSRFEIREIEAPKTGAAALRADQEAALLLKASEGARRIALDERGKDLSSAALAKMLAAWRDDGISEAAFLIGGADGHGPAAVESADILLSLGRATWPHMLVRAMLCEQIYRAMTILSGHPYHRA